MKVLFICRGNVARSQEAAAFYNRLTSSQDATSVGIEAIIGKPIDPMVITCMQEIGMDLSTCERKQISLSSMQDVEIIISFVPIAEISYPVPDDVELILWDVPDPRGQDSAGQRAVRDQIQAKVEALVGQ